MASGEQEFSMGALAVAWFGRKWRKIRVIKDNRKELHPVPVYEGDSDEEDTAVEYQDTDEDPESEEELYLYKQQWDIRGHPDVTSIPIERSVLCHYVQTLDPDGLYRWVPATNLRASEGSQPFRPGFEHAPNIVYYYTKPPGEEILQQKSFEMDPLLPFKVDRTPCEQTNLKRNREGPPPSSWFLENAKLLYNNYTKALEQDYRLLNSRATLDSLLYDTRDKHVLVVEDVMSAADVEEYFGRWKRHFSSKSKTPAAAGGSGTMSCVVCEQASGRLRACPRCPAVYHLPCRKQWLVQIIHDRSPPRAGPSAADAAGAALPAELRDVLPCAACVWKHRPSEKRWCMRLWPTGSPEASAAQPDAPPEKQPRL